MDRQLFNTSINEMLDSQKTSFPKVLNFDKNDPNYLALTNFYHSAQLNCVVEVMQKSLDNYSRSEKAKKEEVEHRQNMLDHMKAFNFHVSELYKEWRTAKSISYNREMIYLQQEAKIKQLEKRIDEITKFL